MKAVLHICLAAGCLPLSLLSMSPGRMDGSLELLVSSDVTLASGVLLGSLEITPKTNLEVQVEVALKDVEYVPNAPIDPFGMETSLDDNLFGLNVAIEQTRGRHEYYLSASAYEGFRSYTAMWIDEYYRQQYSGGGIPGVAYEEPEPEGVGFSAAYQYEVLPASAFLTVSAAYLKDRVAPGYEIEDLGNAFELVRGETTLHTWTGSIGYEAILSKWARTRQQISLSETSTREIRLSWTGAINIAIGEKWISRTSASWASEDPGFEAWSVSQTFEYELSDDWALSMTARYYDDTGQIETANLISSAAPALSTRQVFLGLRKSVTGSDSAILLSAGPYLSDYAETGIGTERFSNLYADRDWWWGRLSFRKAF